MLYLLLAEIKSFKCSHIPLWKVTAKPSPLLCLFTKLNIIVKSMNFGHWSQCCWYCHGARSARRERGDCDQCRDMCQCAGVASHRGAHAAPCQG